MNILLNYVTDRLDEFDSNNKFYSERIRYIRSKREIYIIWLIVVKYFIKSDKLLVSSLFNLVKRNISKQSYFNILSEFEVLGILSKISVISDSRQKLVIPTYNGLQEYSNWSNHKILKKSYNINISRLTNNARNIQ